jgi:hypothetical protein
MTTVSHEADPQTPEFAVARASAEELAWFVDAVNRSLADEATVKGRLALFKEGVNLTDRLRIEGESGWFRPMLHDLLARGVSVVVNDIGLTAPACAAVGRITGIPAEWVFQQNLYITPEQAKGFVAHCDPHIVAVAHLYGRKEWVLYERTLDNPVEIPNESDSALVAKPGEELPVRRRVLVEPGDCFVIPRGRFHSARALTAGSVHLAIGCAGIRPVDYVWRMAEAAMAKSDLRADLDPAAALKRAKAFAETIAPAPLRLPRNPVAKVGKGARPDRATLSFEEALRALPGG